MWLKAWCDTPKPVDAKSTKKKIPNNSKSSWSQWFFFPPINRVVLFKHGHMQPIRSGEISKSPRSKLIVELSVTNFIFQLAYVMYTYDIWPI